MATPVEAAPRAQFSPGLQVEVGRIGRELKTLWEQTGGTKSRASLINLAVYSEEPGSLAKNTELISQITQSHACRAIVIGANPAATENRVEAWISAHCHMPRAGGKQICCEQLSFLLEGASSALLTNTVFAHLDSDLPLYLWWQGEFHDPMDPQLWAWVDRLIYDSQTWKDFDAQIRRIETAQEEAKQRVVLCDLNWTRIVQLRLALAQFFDCREEHAQLSAITGAEVEFAPGFRSTAILLLGWLTAQLDWEPGDVTHNEVRFKSAAGTTIEASLHETAGEPISRFVLRSGATEFCVLHAPEADLLDVTVLHDGAPRMHQLMPAGNNDPARLLTEELMRGGPHRVYLRALKCVRRLL